MFSKILVANRGEIACRVIRTARRLGMRTVAVYSDADAGALHVATGGRGFPHRACAGQRKLSERRAHHRGGRTHRRRGDPSRLRLSVRECRRSRKRCEAAGMVFIGPSADAIRAMGLKDAAKALMQRAGVPVVPGYHGDEQDAAFLRRAGARSAFRC